MDKCELVYKGEKKNHRFSIRMSRELFILVKIKAMKERRGVAEVVRELLRGWLDE